MCKLNIHHLGSRWWIFKISGDGVVEGKGYIQNYFTDSVRELHVHLIPWIQNEELGGKQDGSRSIGRLHQW